MGAVWSLKLVVDLVATDGGYIQDPDYDVGVDAHPDQEYSVKLHGGFYFLKCFKN